jgi:hypothetical protein
MKIIFYKWFNNNSIKNKYKMSIYNNNNNVQNSNYNNKKEYLTKSLFNITEDIEHRTKTLKIKDIQIKENIRSIKLKEKKHKKITEEILTRKEELKLLKELLDLKEQNSMNSENIICSYLNFIISSNLLLDDKLNSLMQKELNINMKMKSINKLMGKEIYDDNYDLSLNDSINKPLDLSKFILKPKKKKVINNGGDNLDNIFMNKINNNNLFSIKRNINISSGTSGEKISNGIKINDDTNKTYNINKFINKDLTKFQKYKLNTVNVSRVISNNNSNTNTSNKLEREYEPPYNNYIHTYIGENKEKEKNKEQMHNYSLTDKNDYLNYNLKPNKKLKSARDTFKKLLFKMNKSNELIFSTNKGDDLKDFFLSVLNTHFFLRKILYILYESAEIYNINKSNLIETIHDTEFISKLIENYEDVGEKYDLKELNNIQLYEKGLEEIKKISLETKELEDKITSFANKINIYG